MAKIIKVKLLNRYAQLPKKSYSTDTGYDLFMPRSFSIDSGDTGFLSLGIAIEPPKGYYCEIIPRSSMATKGLCIPNSLGVIDAGYRGEIKIPLRNISDDIVFVDRGERLAQLILRPLIDAEIIQAEELTDTERGCGGFGSTGK